MQETKTIARLSTGGNDRNDGIFISLTRDRVERSRSCEKYEERIDRVENERNGGKVSDSEKMKGSGGWSVNGDLGPPYMLMLD